ncbi:MAG: aldehyde dehydrogenase, partial [Bacteroidota bacterium]|nr:aldehyde dehydrogenase [Bacteroidota bacterium]
MSDVQTASANVVEKPKFKDQYENFIGGKWTSPVKGQYFDNVSPVDGANFTRIPRSTSEDIEKAIDAA